ncbi:DUF5979 domain-containing protein [Leucobacter komagatae]|uniref:DUF5979 domain-containing protein n=1 Tax=Leucobacter komagatae TaxID=55969 RepID=UPI0031D2F307
MSGTGPVLANTALAASHGDTPPLPASDPFVAPACEGSSPSDSDLAVTGQQLENYNRGGIAVLYGSSGKRSDRAAQAPGCGTRYVASEGGPVSEWMYCTDMAKDTCLNVRPDGSLETKDGSEKVTPLEWLDGNDKLTPAQTRVIAYILQNDLTITRPPAADVTRASNLNVHERYARQMLVWCVSDGDLFGAGGENNRWCNANMSAERQAEILTSIPETPLLELSLSGGYPELPVGVTARLRVSTNLFNQPIELTTIGEDVAVCDGDATLQDGRLTVRGSDPNVAEVVELCVTGNTPGVTTVELGITPQSSKYLSWAQSNHFTNSETCQVFAAFERSRPAKVGALTRLNFVEDAGTFSLRKELSGIPSSAFPKGTTFPVHATWEGGAKTIELPADGTPVPSGVTLPEGTVVTLTEGDLPETPEGYTFTSNALSAETITILADDNPDIAWSVTNTYKRELNGFNLRKTLSGVSAKDFPAGTHFTITASWTVDGKETSREFSLPADGSIVTGPTNLPVGTSVTLKEIKIPKLEGYTFTGVTFTPDTFKIATGQPLQITAENTYHNTPLASEGTFSLRKELSGIPSSAFPKGTTFPVHATWEGGAKTIELPADGTPVPSGVTLPEGTVVTLTEGDLPEAPEGYTFTSNALSAETITILADDNPDIAWSVTNTYKRELNGFNLRKTLSGVSAKDFPAGTHFTITASWTVDGKETSREFSLPADGSIVTGPTNLPVGTSVTLKEIKIPKLEGYTFTGVTFTPDTFKIATGQPLQITAENTYRNTPLVTTGNEGFLALATLGGVLTVGGFTLALLARKRSEV